MNNYAQEERGMHSQSYTAKELARCASCTEMHDLEYANRDELENELEELMIPLIESDGFRMEWKCIGELCVNSKRDDKQYLYQNLLVRKICKNVGGIYKVKQANRNAIIRQVRSLMKAPCELYVLRLDIHHFYESIDGAYILERLRVDGKVNAQTIKYVERIFETIWALGVHGLPKGVGISAVFSELLMKKFDYEVKRLDGVYYYARFVDDMILFCNSQSVMDAAYKRIEELLGEMQLSLNDRKTIRWTVATGKPLEYLGYSFTKVSAATKQVEVSIAVNKVNKIKTRIVRSFMAYMRNRNFVLLRKRVRYLTGNFSLRVNDSPIQPGVGLYYNYKYIDKDSSALQDLQSFYWAILHCRNGRLGTALVHNLSLDEYKELESYSFVFGFRNKVHHAFLRSEIWQITGIW